MSLPLLFLPEQRRWRGHATGNEAAVFELPSCPVHHAPHGPTPSKLGEEFGRPSLQPWPFQAIARADKARSAKLRTRPTNAMRITPAKTWSIASRSRPSTT